jgi:hypothetical protein
MGARRPGRAGSLDVVPTLVQDPQPAEFEALLERRRDLGQDLLDEACDGVYHMNPAPSLLPRVGIFNLGEPQDYLVPD